MDLTLADLAAKVIGVLAPYAAKGAEEFAQAAGQAACDKVKGLLAKLKERWAGDDEAELSLTQFEKKPERYRTSLEDLLKEKLAEDPGLVNEVKTLLAGLGPQLDVIQKMDVGKKISGLDVKEMTGGRARVEQEIRQAEDVTGARIERIGD
jgi:hypothetical protein